MDGDQGPEAPAGREVKVTTVFRREDGGRNIIHRHGDARPDGDSDALPLQLGRFEELDGRTTPDGYPPYCPGAR